MFPTIPTLSTLPPLASQPFKRAALGLFHGKLIQYGNNVPHSKKKTRRNWLPNVQSKTLTSELMERSVKVKVTTRALRTINKHGGLDQYLLSTSPSLLGDEGMRLRILVREKFDAKNALEAHQAQRAAEKAAKAQEAKKGDRVKSHTQRAVKERGQRRESESKIVQGIFGAST
ncbi:hypothetical protein BDN67DRAFT_965196 [Paxillus ammoniavirescens]|nr:hypothetical protein BDN67DRAFT_965196 [Paxillus ammoniavirescens]